MIATAIRDALVADTTFTALLGTFNSQPAVFIDRTTPPSFERGGRPYVLVPGPSAVGPYLDGDQDFFEVGQTIFIAAAYDGDPTDVDAAALHARRTLEAAVGVAPAGHVQASGGLMVEGPADASPDDLTHARELAVRLWLIKVP